MNRSKKLYILLGVLAVVCVITFAVCKYEEDQEQIKNSDEIILEIMGDDVQSISWEYGSKEFAFHKDENWIYDEDETFPVDEEKINDLLEVFEEFGVSFIIEEVEDYDQYGLEDPVCTINIETEDESYEIKLGDYSTMDSERYVSIGDGNVYLVSTDPADSYNVDFSDMIKHDEVPDFDEVNEIQFAGAEEYQIVYEEDSANTYCADDVYFTDDKPLDTSNVDSYLNTISNLGLTDYVTYNASEEEVETYGLDDPDLTVSVQYIVEADDEETEETFILNVARDPEAKEDEEDVTGYVRVGESGIIYVITSDEYASLMAASYNDLRHEEILSADFADIYQIDISLEGEDYTITSEEKDDEILYYYGEEELEIADLQSAIEALVADEFTEEEPEEKEEISFTVYLDNKNYPEVKVELYRYDGNNCLAVIDGEPVALVARNYVVDLIEAVNAIVLN